MWNCLRAGEQTPACCILGLLSQLKLQTKELAVPSEDQTIAPGDNRAVEINQALAVVA